VPKQIDKTLKTELLTTERKLRNDAPVTHYELSAQNRAQPHTTSLALEEIKEPTPSTSKSATVVKTKNKLDFKGDTVASSAALPSSPAADTKTTVLATPLTAAVEPDINLLLPTTSTLAIAPPTIKLDAIDPIIKIETTDQDDEMAEAINPSLFMGLPDDDTQTWYTGLLDFMEYKAIADDKKLSLFKLRLGDMRAIGSCHYQTIRRILSTVLL